MGKLLIIGAGGVGSVVTQKCAQVPEVFSEIMLASRSIDKCKKIQKMCKNPIQIAQVDADKSSKVAALIKKFKPELVINVALPYQDLTIMKACLATGVNYIDTANYEPPEKAHFEYSWQWAFQKQFQEAGIMAVLGAGFDPGASNVYCAYAQKHYFDEIHYIDIVDCNAGSHGHPFATNFNPEINIREVTQVVRHWADGKWIETPAILEPKTVHMSFDYPEVGPKESYMLFHEELESLVLNIRGLKRIRFWMTFSENYLNHLRVLQNVGMTRIDPVKYEGHNVIPLKFLKSVLPDPASLAPTYTGKTSIGCVFTGIKDGKEKTNFIYNVCDHAECYKEVKAQAVSYTTGVGTLTAAILVMKKIWKGAGVFNMEQFDPDPYMDLIGKYGLPWQVVDWQKMS